MQPLSSLGPLNYREAPERTFLGFASDSIRTLHVHPEAPFDVTEGTSVYDGKRLVMKKAKHSGLKDAVENERRVFDRLADFQGQIIPRLSWSGEFEDCPVNVFEALPDAEVLTLEMLREMTVLERMDLIEQSFLNLYFLHERGILHGDRALANTVLSEGKLYTIDFGSSVIQGDASSRQRRDQFESSLKQSLSMSAHAGHAHAPFMTSRMEHGMPLDEAGEIEQEGMVALRMLFVKRLSMNPQRDIEQLRRQLDREVRSKSEYSLNAHYYGDYHNRLTRLLEVLEKMTKPVSHPDHYDASEHYQSMGEILTELGVDRFKNKGLIHQKQQAAMVSEAVMTLLNFGPLALENEPELEMEPGMEPERAMPLVPPEEPFESQPFDLHLSSYQAAAAVPMVNLTKRQRLQLFEQFSVQVPMIDDLIRRVKNSRRERPTQKFQPRDGIGEVIFDPSQELMIDYEGFTAYHSPGNQRVLFSLPQNDGSYAYFQIGIDDVEEGQQLFVRLGEQGSDQALMTLQLGFDPEDDRCVSCDIEMRDLEGMISGDEQTIGMLPKNALELITKISDTVLKIDECVGEEAPLESDEPVISEVPPTPSVLIQKVHHFDESHLRRILARFPQIDREDLEDGINLHLANRIGPLFNLTGEEVIDKLAELFEDSSSEDLDERDDDVLLA